MNNNTESNNPLKKKKKQSNLIRKSSNPYNPKKYHTVPVTFILFQFAVLPLNFASTANRHLNALPFSIN